MRLCAWAGAQGLLPVLVLLMAPHVEADQRPPRERHYYIAAVEIDWKYSGNDTNRSDPTYRKVVFREYEEDFRQAKTHPPWLGLLGPTLRAEEGEMIVVTFRNMATMSLSIHPHGVTYGKQSEGASYFDNTSLKEKEDDMVQPHCEHVYYWEATTDVSPQPHDPNCLTYTYISHQNVVKDYNSGLIGTLLICKTGTLDESGRQIGVHQEYVFLFGVFDEKRSQHEPSGAASDNHVKYTINGYANGSLPDVSVCAHAPVSLHLLGMSSGPEVFSVHMNGQVLQQAGHKVSSVGLISGSTATVSLVALYTGRWLFSSHTIPHIEAGLHGFVDVTTCDGFKAPKRWLTSAQKKQRRDWRYFIAAEEVIWDYAPNMPEHIEADFKLRYLTRSTTRIGRKYKKAVYTQYKDESFTEKLETKQRKNELGILGPVIRAQIRDVITIVFKNMASRPYSIYPHGLTIEKSEEGVNYPEGGNHSHGVQPGETHTYVWKVVEDDEPLEGDSRCLTRMYHSAVDTPRDISSGLIGPMLICKTQSLNVRNVQLKADKEQHAIFSVFDENKSWYQDFNINHSIDRYKILKTDPEFYRSNVKHTINGYMFESGTVLGFCNGEVATWHVSSIGVQDYIQTATFYGHMFELHDRMEDFLSLYPMTGETITMNMDNIGFWLLASLNSHWTTRGMRVKFQDVECLRDYQYEYDSGGAEKEFTVWHPPSLNEIQVAEKKLEIKNEIEEVVDYYTAKFADELGLRSLRNQSSSSDIEHLDLSFLDYDAIDVHDGDTNIAFNFKGTKNKNNAVSETKNTTIYNATAISVAVNVSTDLTVTLEETTNLTVLLPGNQTSVDAISEEDSEERLTRGAVFPYSVPLSSPSNRNCTPEGSLSNNTPSGGQNENSTAANHVNGSAGATNHLVSFPGSDIRDTNVSSMDRCNMSILVLEGKSTNNKTNDTASLSHVAGLENGPQMDSSDAVINPVNSSLENVTHGFLGTLPSQNVTGNVTYPDIASSDRSNSTGRISLESKENITARLGELNHTSSAEGFSNETVVSGNLSLSSGAVKKEGSAVLYDSESSEEVLIYLKENNTEGIKTTAIKTQGHNWTYEGTHQMVPVEIPDHMMKYFEEETPQTTPAPKKKKVVTVRQWPQRGEGMKTKKKKSYKPQARSGLPFSPHGFNPGMTPRGSRPIAPQPVSNEEDLINVPVVIGLPRPDFSDYELYVPGDEPAHLDSEDQNLEDNEYEYVMFKDPYGSNEDMKHLNLDETSKYYLKLIGPNVRVYFIAAEETEWDYSGYGQRRQDKLEGNIRKTTFTKVVFRSYMDSSFTTPEIRGEIDEHLGILGPVIKAEVGQSIIVVFRNSAKRPYSIHPNGVIYAKQTEGLSYEDGSKHWFKYDNEVQPNTSFTYLWKVNSAAGPMTNESDCRTWAYYSGVNPERDIHSGLIGPLLVCRKGTLTSADTREFILLFMTFDETQSWYFENNREIMKRKSRKRLMDPNFRENLKFHSINGIIYNLKGLRMYTKQLVRWHLINMGSPKDFQTVHFHGQTFVHKKTNGYRQAVFPLLPGSFATLEMLPTKPGLWQLETEVGLSQQSGMQTLFLVLDNDCYRPLGLESGSVKDIQITAINTRGYWEPRLARLNLKGQYNAWSTEQNNSWIQVDFQRPVVISQVATQGAKQIFQSQFVVKFLISYSTDRRKWIFYKGNSTDFRKVFPGNQEAYKTKLNTFFPPLIGRFIRLHPIEWSNKATVRMEFYGCELDGCSVPLGMESGHIADSRISASSTASSWYSGPWKPSLARLDKQGTVNAWQAKYNDMNQWLQVELPNVTKITGIITQGAKSMGQAMYVMSYTLQYSSNGIHWEQYTDEEDYQFKTFSGNEDNNDHVKNYIYPPIFSRFIRIVPRTWRNSITMRIELLGCDFE